LNRTGFNGLFRLNASGEFNVPAGRYDAPRILDVQRLEAAAALLRHTELRRLRFEDALADVRGGDLVYLDPPYAPLSPTANFRAYTAAGFDADDQRRLRDEVVRLARQDVQVVLSNSTAPAVVSLYESAPAQNAGLRCYRLRARRAINTNPNGRGLVDELIVTNLPQREVAQDH
jgi:DNA adenine methylase